MLKLIKSTFIISAVVFFTSCSILAASMSPTEVYNTLPKLTKSKFISQEEVKNSNCKYLVKGRSYTSPSGITVKNDLKNGAKGIDDWVKLDGGNTYVLTSYKWVVVGNNGDTQLHVEFDTLLCE